MTEEDWGEIVNDRGVPDQFGVPPNLMGRHPEEFFSVLGRIVALTAILENKILFSTNASSDGDRMSTPDCTWGS